MRRRLYALAGPLALALALPAQALAADRAQDRPDQGIPARALDRDPEDRPDRPLDHEGRLLPAARDGDPARRHAARGTAPAPAPEEAAGVRRDRLRLQRDPDRPRVAAREDVHDVVPVPRHAVPLHLGQQHHLVHPAAGRHGAQVWQRLPTPSFYAATSNISVTLALTLVTFFASHYVGIQHNGVRAYFKHWFPPVPGAINFLIVPLEMLSQFLRLVSLSVRLFANMLAGHLLVLMCVALIIIIGNVFVAPRRPGRPCSSTASSSCSWPTCRRSSSRFCPASTSVPRSSRITDPGGDSIHGTRR